jgi:hypothetical protein
VNSSGSCAATMTPFMEVTLAAGHVIEAFQPAFFMR